MPRLYRRTLEGFGLPQILLSSVLSYVYRFARGRAYLLPRYSISMLSKIRITSVNLERRFFSCKNIEPMQNETTTLPRRIIDTTAIVMGDIKSKLVQINNGAVIEGHCSQCYSDNSPKKFFGEN